MTAVIVWPFLGEGHARYGKRAFANRNSRYIANQPRGARNPVVNRLSMRPLAHLRREIGPRFLIRFASLLWRGCIAERSWNGPFLEAADFYAHEVTNLDLPSEVAL